MNFPTIETCYICWGLGAIGMNERNKLYLLTIAFLQWAIGIWNEIWNEISSRGSRALILLWREEERSEEDWKMPACLCISTKKAFSCLSPPLAYRIVEN
jgi:hypothetical protein